jgi:hypothetical protein
MPVFNPLGAGGLPNYWNPQRLEPSIILPSTYLACNFNAGIGAWGAWIILQPLLAQDSVLTALHCNLVTTASMSCWIQVGWLPPSGPPVVPFTESGIHAFVAGTGASPIHGTTARLAPIPVPLGTTVYIRAYKTAGHVGCSAFLSLVRPAAAWYSPWPNTYIAGARATVQRRFPAVPGWQASSNQPVWTQVYAAAPNNMLLTAAEWDPANVAGLMGEVIEVGVGAAGSEVVLARVGIPSLYVNGWAFGYQEFGRKAIILAGERVVVRHQLAGANRRVALYFEDI